MDKTIKEQLLTLTELESRILYWVCKGWTYEQMISSEEADIHYSVPAITLFMSSVYEKIGLDDEKIHHTKRRKILKEKYCPVLTELMKGNFDFQPNSIEPPQIKPETYGLAVIDNHELVKAGEKGLTVWQKKERGIIIIDDEKKDGRIKWWHTLIIAVLLLGTCYGGTLIGKTLFSTSTTIIDRIIETSVVTEQVLATLIQTEIHTQIAYIEITSTPEPITSTPQPTSTPEPTSTSTVSPYLFRDDFNDGLLPEWNVFAGEPLYVQGGLTTSEDLILFTGDETWTDYSVSIEGPCSIAERFGGTGCLLIVRAKDTQNYIAWMFYKYEGWWVTVTDGVVTKIENSGYRSVATNPKNLRIIVEGDKFTTFINNNFISTIINTNYPSGGIGLKLRKLTKIDNLVVARYP